MNSVMDVVVYLAAHIQYIDESPDKVVENAAYKIAQDSDWPEALADELDELAALLGGVSDGIRSELDEMTITDDGPAAATSDTEQDVGDVDENDIDIDDDDIDDDGIDDPFADALPPVIDTVRHSSR